MLPHRLFEKAQGRLLITMGGEEKVDRLAIPIDSAVEVLPLVFDFDVGLMLETMAFEIDHAGSQIEDGVGA